MQPYHERLSKHLSPDAVHNIERWLSEPKYAEYKTELEAMIDDEQWSELENAFFKVLEFGTAGRRGTTGVGSNRINRITIGESAQALCMYAVSRDETARDKGIVIACDNRTTSEALSKYAAQVCAANGVKTFIFDSFRATPELSFAVRHLGAAAGIVISASHNPPLDNGFKAYWSDGAQLVSPHGEGVLEVAETITEIVSVDFDQSVAQGLITIIGTDVDTAYINAVVSESEGSERDVALVYSPLHGTGQTNVLPVLRQAGFENISLVKDQMVPDGNFPTIDSGKANPEEKEANNRAVAQLLAERADIAITNDPDADRIGVMVRQGDDAVYLSGNQSLVLATDYALSKLQKRGELTNRHYIAKTIVTTEMLQALADHYNVTLYGNMLIGFKYIGELILQKESTDEAFVIGGEESYGLLKGTYARDKDGAAGALPLAEYAAELKKSGKTLNDRLFELYNQHGLYVEHLSNAYFTGAAGFSKMQAVMNEMRTNAPKSIDGHTVTAVRDYKTLTRTNTITGETSGIDCASGNVIALELDGDSRRRITVRPSGTEPKIKFYIQWFEDADETLAMGAQYDTATILLESLAKTMEGLVLDT